MAKSGATSYKQTRFGILPRSKVLKLEIEGTKKGLVFLQKIAQAKEKITPDLIKKIHKESFGDIMPEDAGKFRTEQVTYSSKEAPHYSKVPEMIKTLCDDAEYALSHLPKLEEEETFISALVEILARFQHRFVFIHPFKDYNGRTARMFTNYILMRLSLPITEIKVEGKKDRVNYIKTLQVADKGDYSELESIITTSLEESLGKVNLQ